MFDALAQRVVVLPSTAFAGGQQPPEDDAVTGLPRDSNVSTAAACGAVTVPIARTTATPPANLAIPLFLRFTPQLPPVLTMQAAADIG